MHDAERPLLILTFRRNPRNADLVDYTFASTWWTFGKGARPEAKHHRKLRGEGSIVHPKPVKDVRVVIHEIADDMLGSGTDGVPGTPGRERSGFEHVPLPLEPPSAPPPGPPEAS